MPLSFRRRLRPFGAFFQKIGRRVGEAVVRGSEFIERGLGKAIPVTEKILGFAEKVPVPFIQRAAAIGREAVQVAKGFKKGAGEIEKFSKKLSGRGAGSSHRKSRARQLIKQSETIR